MARSPVHPRQLSRRELLKQVGFTSASFAIAPLVPQLLPAPSDPLPAPGNPLTVPSDPRGAEEQASWTDIRFVPHYPAPSPLDDVLRLVTPGADEFATEAYAAEIATTLDVLRDALLGHDAAQIAAVISSEAQALPLRSTKVLTYRQVSGIDSARYTFAAAGASPATYPLREQLLHWLDPGRRPSQLSFQITAIEQTGAAPLSVRSTIQYTLCTEGPDHRREQRMGTWEVHWIRQAETSSVRWQAQALQPVEESVSSAPQDSFVDITSAALGSTSSYRDQLTQGIDTWRSRIDGACGIDVYGNNGIAAGDFNNDGWEDLYVSQPSGLPNRLYRNRGDGTFDDVTEQAGVGVLENTACALFADLRNIGLQDLLVVCGSGPLLFLNQGDGTFACKRDAFQFAQPPQGTFTHAAIADYDGDGRLDIYFCLYSYYLGLDQYHYPAPYFDARNGPPNFLFHNAGDATFVDRSAVAGLNSDNDRYSFACAWGNSGPGKLPDLYVVNDFGRNNFYRNNGDGTFRSAAHEAHLEDVGAGMSAAWGAVRNEGRSDLYVADMWSAAGLRISQQPQFHRDAPASVRELYRRHASGNALYTNQGNGRFVNASEQAGVANGGWAWSSDFWDFDHDGFQDLYVTNGYITGPAENATSGATPDLASFFWRQVVGRSPEDATPSLAYERGWNALNELIRSDASWSGRERNVALANHQDGTFSDVSGALGLDFLEDGRSFALADLDGDGRLELILKNRNAPQLRIVRNALPALGDAITFRLRGTQSNRDAIGTSIRVTSGSLHQTRSLQAGTGFLAQHTKELHFGLGHGAELVDAEVHWPSGLTQQFTHLPRNSRVQLEEGSSVPGVKPYRETAAAYRTSGLDVARLGRAPEDTIGTWLLEPLTAPAFSLPDLSGDLHSLESLRGNTVALHLWSVQFPGFEQQLQVFKQLSQSRGRPSPSPLAINLDTAQARARAQLAVSSGRLPYPILFATDEVAGVYNITFRYLFDRRANLPLPTTLLLDRDGMIVKVYQGPISAADLLRDAGSIPQSAAERMHRGLPFPGRLMRTEYLRNDFTYGVAMFQHGYLDQATASFQQVVAARPNDPEAHYNLGTLNLRRNRFAEAQRYLERTLQLKPNYPEAWNNLGMMAAQNNRDDEAIRDFEQSLALRPTYAIALLNLGNVYRRQKNFAKAGDALARSLRLQPDDPETNYSMGMLAAQQAQLPEATRYLQRAIALRPGYPEALNNLGVLFVREQNFDEAEQQFRTCIHLEPGFDQSYLNLARLYLVQREPDKAKATLHALLRLKPESAAARQALSALGESF